MDLVGEHVDVPKTEVRRANRQIDARLAALECIRGAVTLVGIEADADHAQRMPLRVALDDPTAFLDPEPAVVTIAQPIFHGENGSTTLQMLGECGAITRQVVGMHARRPEPFVAIARELCESRLFAPIVDPRQPILGNVPVPQADLGSPECQFR